MEDTRMANSALEAGGTSRRSVGKGGGEPVSTGCRGLTTGVRQRGQKEAVESSSTPQLTQ